MRYRSQTFIMAFLLLCCIHVAEAQKKKELIAQIKTLQSELATTKTDLAQSRKNEASSSARVTAVETELTEIRETNATLLKNLNRITEESSKKTASISESLTNIQRTERQLRMISETLTRRDSTTLSIVTALKQTLGENAKLGISNNVVTIALENSLLFGEDNSYRIDTAATSYLGKIADILKKHPDTKLDVECYANALNFGNTAPSDNLELSGLRAVAATRIFKEAYGINEGRLIGTGKGIEGLSVETSTRFRIRPDYEAFFRLLKETIKN